MEHHDLQKCLPQNKGGPGCKEENPAPQWLLTITSCHKKRDRSRCKLKERKKQHIAPQMLS